MTVTRRSCPGRETTELVSLCRRQQWLAILFGPFGCTLRWVLSKSNYKLPGSWKWLPIGTFAANMLGCTIDYFVGVSHLGCFHCR